MTDIASAENESIVGREDLHDIEGILSVVGSDEGETIRAVGTNTHDCSIAGSGLPT